MSALLKNVNTGKTKKTYTFDEVLTIIVLANKDVSTKKIAEVVGHSEYSVNYKKSIWLKKQIEKNGENTMSEICKEFGSKLLSDSEIEARVEDFLKSKTA